MMIRELHPIARAPLVAMVAVLLSSGISPAQDSKKKQPGFAFTILHTNDLHSSIKGSNHNGYFTREVGDGDPVRGHYARLVHLISSIREENTRHHRPTLLVDSGDFFSGTVYHVLAPSPASQVAVELAFFDYLRYDAVTLGNHEFDAGFLGFSNMLEKNRHYGVPIVSTNIRLPTSTAPGKRSADPLDQLQPYIMKELHDGHELLRVGILGVLGPNGAKGSLSNRAPISFVGFRDDKAAGDLDGLVQATQREIDRLYSLERADIVVLLLHGGDPEDAELARKLRGVQVILAGHVHDEYRQVRTTNGVFVAQAGSDGRVLGQLDLLFQDGVLSLLNQNRVLHEIDDAVAADEEYLSAIEGYDEELNRVFSTSGYRVDTPVFDSEIALPIDEGARSRLGTFVLSEIRNQLNAQAAEPVDIYFNSLTCLRSGLELVDGQRTTFLFSDVFHMLSLGFSDSFEPGYPIVSFYLTRQEVKMLVDLMEIYQHVDRNFIPVYSDSISFEVRDLGIPFINRIKNLRLHGKQHRDWPPLIKFATTEMIASYLYRIKDLTWGIFALTPKDRLGNPISTPEKEGGFKEYLLFIKALIGRTLTTADLPW